MERLFILPKNKYKSFHGKVISNLKKGISQLGCIYLNTYIYIYKILYIYIYVFK